MKLKSIFADKPAFFQLLLLFFLILTGALIASGLSAVLIFIYTGSIDNLTDYPDLMRWVQLLSAVFSFLLPSLICSWLCSYNPYQYLGSDKLPSLDTFFLSLGSMILVAPAINLSGYLNKQIQLPSFMAPIEKWMQEQEALAEHLTQLLLADNSAISLLLNLLVVAVAAAITEEFLFRGALQRILSRLFPNPHIAIWFTAILFSAFHMQFYGFFPRMFLGAYFGYLIYWSRSIWLPVFAHFINNFIGVIAMSGNSWEDHFLFTNDFTSTLDLLLNICISIGFLGLFYLCVKKLRISLTKG